MTNNGFEEVGITSLVVFTNNDITVTNDYGYIQNCSLNQLVQFVDNTITGKRYSYDKIYEMSQCVLNAQTNEDYPMYIDMQEYKNTFARLVATLERTKA